MTKNDALNMDEYRQIFGSEKMRKLWQEFMNEAKTYLEYIEDAEAEKQQIRFHNLRAYALVFDMNDFADICTQMEEKILSLGPISSSDAIKVRSILKKSIIEVEQKLAG